MLLILKYVARSWGNNIICARVASHAKKRNNFRDRDRMDWGSAVVSPEISFDAKDCLFLIKGVLK